MNDEITAATVRLVGADGQMIGIVSREEALAAADAASLDLVEINPQAEPPVCKILDYGKFKYEAQKRAAEARKKQKVVEVKELKFSPNIDNHDYDVKLRNAERFLRDGDKVRFVVRFRGREITHQELGADVLKRAAERLAELSKIEQAPRLDGRHLVMVLAPR